MGNGTRAEETKKEREKETEKNLGFNLPSNI